MAIETISILDAVGATKTVLADLIGTDYGQVIKVAFGSDGSITLVDASNGMPVSIIGTPTVTVSALPAGGNTIGNVVLAAGANLIGQVDLNSVPASARTTDSNAIANAVDVLMDNLTQLTVKKAFVNVGAGSTDSSIVAAVSTKKIHVVSFRLHCGGTATNVTFNSKPAGAGTAISETFALGANGGRAESYNPVGHFWSNTSEGLTVTTGAGSTVGVGVVYVEKS